jgi:hypothetical protein
MLEFLLFIDLKYDTIELSHIRLTKTLACGPIEMEISEPLYEIDTLLLVPQFVLMLSEEEVPLLELVPLDIPKVDRCEKWLAIKFMTLFCIYSY